MFSGEIRGRENASGRRQRPKSGALMTNHPPAPFLIMPAASTINGQPPESSCLFDPANSYDFCC
jgi:hypothetical protein